MPRYRLWCRTQQLSEEQHIATVSAVLADAGPTSAQVESETRVLASRELALAAVAQMACAMRDRLERRGGEVVGTDMV